MDQIFYNASTMQVEAVYRGGRYAGSTWQDRGFEEATCPEHLGVTRDHKVTTIADDGVVTAIEASARSYQATVADVDTARDERIAAMLTAAVGKPFTAAEARQAVSDGDREATRLLNIRLKHVMAKQADPDTDVPDWTADQAKRAAQLESLDAAVDGIEQAAEALKAMDPIPADYATNDSYWA